APVSVTAGVPAPAQMLFNLAPPAGNTGASSNTNGSLKAFAGGGARTVNVGSGGILVGTGSATIGTPSPTTDTLAIDFQANEGLIIVSGTTLTVNNALNNTSAPG